MSKILLCGAADLKNVEGQFKKVVDGFAGDMMCFTDASIDSSNYKSWAENSDDAVTRADIVVFVIVENFGEITWDIEYQAAKKYGKEFLIFCHKGLYDDYLAIKKRSFIISPKSPNKKIFNWLKKLNDEEQKTIVSYEYHEFEKKLKEQLKNIYQNAFDESKKKKAANNNKKNISEAKSSLLTQQSFDEKIDGFMLAINLAQQKYKDEVTKVAHEANHKLRNLDSCGIYDAYKDLEATKMLSLGKTINGGELRLLRMYLSEPEMRIVKSSLKKFITDNKCNFRIILLAPTQKKVIESRLKHTSHKDKAGRILKHDCNHYLSEIISQLHVLDTIKKELKQLRLDRKLQIRVHEDFIACAMIAYKDEILYSNYLHGRVSEDGVQIRTRGEGTPHYQELSKHFEIQWKNAFDYIVEKNGKITIIRPENAKKKSYATNQNNAVIQHSKDKQNRESTTKRTTANKAAINKKSRKVTTTK